jgi:uncharacterized protein (TIGR04141 family)
MQEVVHSCRLNRENSAMSHTNEKMQVAIFQIDTSIYAGMDFDDIVDDIVHNAPYDEQKLVKKVVDDFHIRVFYRRRPHPPAWQSFFVGVVAPGEDLLKFNVINAAFMCFIDAGASIYAIGGGQGIFELQGHMVTNFGTEILVRLIERNSKVIKGLQERGVTGTILGETKFFRGDQRMSDEDQFGKIYKEVRAELNVKVLTKNFGFSKAELRRGSAACLAKSSFQINKSLSFTQLLAICARLSAISRLKPKFALNKVILIQNRGERNKRLLKELHEHMIEVLYDHCLNDQLPDFDFCHEDFEAYYSSASHQVYISGDPLTYKEPVNVQRILADMKKKRVLHMDDPVYFKHSFLEIFLTTFDADGESLTSGTILEHFHGEVTYKGRSFFFIDGQWYLIQAEFVSDLNKEAKEMLAGVWEDAMLTEPFDLHKREDHYSAGFIGKTGFCMLDTITADNIELCDLLQYSDDTLHLIHIKKGFNNSIRELANQVAISARRIINDRKSDYSYIDEIEAKLRSGRTSGSSLKQQMADQRLPTKTLADLFRSKRDREIIFCLAFVDEASKPRVLKDELEKFDSNIAKYSLIALKREITGLGFGFKVIQLNKL